MLLYGLIVVILFILVWTLSPAGCSVRNHKISLVSNIWSRIVIEQVRLGHALEILLTLRLHLDLMHIILDNVHFVLDSVDI